MNKTFSFITLCCFVLACVSGMTTPAKADDTSPYTYSVKSVEVQAKDITCHFFDTWSKPSRFEACENFKPPEKMAVGEKYFANGKERIIGKVEVHHAIEKGGLWEKNKLVLAGCSAEEFAVKDFEAFTLLMVEECGLR